MMPIYVKNAAGKRVRTHALLDGGSNRHVVSESICERLGIEGEEIRMSVTTLGSSVDGVRKVSDVDIEGVNGLHVRLQKAIFGEIVAAKTDAPPTADDVIGMEHLSDVQFPAFLEGEGNDGLGIGVIVSAELAGLWLNGERRVGAKGLPVGLKTDLGWGLIGPRDSVDSHFCCHFISSR